MKIIIWDSTAARCIGNREAVESAAGVLGIDIEIQVWTEELAPQNGTLSPECDLLLLHATDEGEANPWFQSKGVSISRVLKYGGREIPGGVARALSDSNPLKDFEARRILEAVRDSTNQETFLERALAIWSAVPENLLSWALLAIYGKGSADDLKNNVRAKAVEELSERKDVKSLDLSNDKVLLPVAQDLIAEYRADV